jgi:hypothetical protein
MKSKRISLTVFAAALLTTFPSQPVDAWGSSAKSFGDGMMQGLETIRRNEREVQQTRSSSNSGLCRAASGAVIVAADGTYLGKVSNSYDPDSIFNEFGNHGSEFSSTSIWNEYGLYGGEYSNTSPFNEFASSPPAIFKNGQKLGLLTVNPSFRYSANPWRLKACGF